MRIVMIGSGNVATVLAKQLLNAGNEIVQVYSRSLSHAMELANQLNAGYIDSLKDLNTNADLYIIAVADKAIAAIADQLSLQHKIIVHTAASVSKDVLKNASELYGVIYPLQSIRKTSDAAMEIPLFVDASDAQTEQQLYEIASSISKEVHKADDAMRLKLHVAAVIVSNFTNHLYALAEQYCEKENIPFQLLHPLLIQTAERVQYSSPQQMQTGPAIRNDVATIQQHLDLLKSHPNLQSLYHLLTESIQQLHNR